MDSLIQRWKSTVGSGQKSGSFSSRTGNPIDEKNMNTSSHSNQNDMFQRERSLSGKKNEKRNLSASSSSSSSSDIPYSNKRHNQSATIYQNKLQEDKLDEIFSHSGTKGIDGSNKGKQQITQEIIKPPLKQHQSPQRNTSQDEKSKLKSLRESYANTKANSQISIPQRVQNQQIMNNNSIQNINSSTARSQIIASSPSRTINAANTNRRSMTFYIDESVFRIVDVFTISKQLDHKEQVSRVRNIIENLVENTKNFYNLNAQNNRSISREDIQSQSQIKETERTLSKIKQTSLAQKAESNSKIVSELENKLFECERARIQLKTENEQQQVRISSLQKEIETIKVTNTMLDMVRESQLLLEKNNKTLHEQLKKEELKNVEQQRIFESQLQEVQLIIHHLKQQLSQAYSVSPTQQLQ